MKACNAAIRKGKTDDERIAGIMRAGLNENMARKLLEPDCFGGIGFQGFTLTNNNANIKRIKARIAELERMQDSPADGWTFDGGEVIANADANRLQIIFDSKPGEEMRTLLKKRGFKWSPRFGAWQRQLNNNAIYAAKDILQTA